MRLFIRCNPWYIDGMGPTHEQAWLRRRTRILFAAYAWLVFLCILDYYVGRIRFGTIAVVSLLVIGYYLRLPAAIVTAIVAGIALAYLDVVAPPIVSLSPWWDAVLLVVSLCVVVYTADILRRRTLETSVLRDRADRAEAAAFTDHLTGIPNRAFFVDRLQKEILAETAVGDKLGVLFADLDGFKAINDTHGHAVGDTALALAARRLSHALRENDVIARVGGDEFGIIVRDVHSRSDLERVCQTIESAFQEPFRLGEVKATLGVTIGSTLFPDDGRGAEELMSGSDAAMYSRKRAKINPRTRKEPAP